MSSTDLTHNGFDLFGAMETTAEKERLKIIQNNNNNINIINNLFAMETTTEQERLNQEEAQPIQLASHQPAQVLRVVFLLTKQIQI